MNCNAAARAADLLKACRDTPITRPQLQEELGWSHDSLCRWTDALLANGILVEGAPVKRSRGPETRSFVVSPLWKGQA